MELNANLTCHRFNRILGETLILKFGESGASEWLAETITSFPVPFTSWRDCVVAATHVVRSSAAGH